MEHTKVNATPWGMRPLAVNTILLEHSKTQLLDKYHQADFIYIGQVWAKDFVLCLLLSRLDSLAQEFSAENYCFQKLSHLMLKILDLRCQCNHVCALKWLDIQDYKS